MTKRPQKRFIVTLVVGKERLPPSRLNRHPPMLISPERLIAPKLQHFPRRRMFGESEERRVGAAIEAMNDRRAEVEHLQTLLSPDARSRETAELVGGRCARPVDGLLLGDGHAGACGGGKM